MSGLWYDDDYSQRLLESYSALLASLTNSAGRVLMDAGFKPSPRPALDDPPGGMEPDLWASIWHEALADDALAFVQKNQAPEVSNAAALLCHVSQISKAFSASLPRPLPLIEAAVFMAIAVSSQMQINGSAEVATMQQIAGQLALAKKGLAQGPQAKRDRANYWKGKLGTFCDEFYGADRTRLHLPAAAVWAEFLAANPDAPATARRLGKTWPTADNTAHKEILKARKTKLG